MARSRIASLLWIPLCLFLAERGNAAAFTVQPVALQVPSGQTGQAVVTVDLGGDPAAKVTAFWASEGSFGKIEPVGGGRFRAPWTAPGLGFPTVVLMRVDWESRGTQHRRWIALPVSIAMDLQVEASRGDRVQIWIGGKDYGPVTAKARGTVTIPIVVPPSAGSYTINRTDDFNVTKSETQRFGLPPFGRMAIIGPKTASAGDLLEIEVFHINSIGLPYTSEVALDVNCPEGRLLEIIGRQAVQRMRIRLGGRTGPLECRVFHRNEPKISISHTLGVTVSRERVLQVEVEPKRLAIDTSASARVLVRAKDLFDNTAEASNLKVSSNGRPVEVTRISPGKYQGWLYAPRTRQPGDVLVVRAEAVGAQPAQAVIELRGGVATRVSAAVKPKEIQADGRRWVVLQVKATDRHGMPASDQSVEVISPHGKLLFLHRVSPGLYRGHFVPHEASAGGKAVLTVQTARAMPKEISLQLKPIPQRLLLSPVVGAFGDLLRTAGVGTALRFEYGAYRGKPTVFVGGALHVMPAFSIEDGEGALIDHRGLAAGAVALLRLRLLATLRFGLDVSFEAGALGLYVSYRQRYQTVVQRNEDARALFTAAVGLEASVVTAGRQEIFFLLQARYVTGRFEDASGEGRVLLLGGLGYRFPL